MADSQARGALEKRSPWWSCGGGTLSVPDEERGPVFRAWGTCFNELDLDALELLQPEEQEEVMHRLFAPDGDLRFRLNGWRSIGHVVRRTVSDKAKCKFIGKKN